jgi:large subunit ribosomal protein L30
MADMIEIKLVRSTIGRKPEQRATVRSLGLRKISSKTVKEATPSVLGMVHAVKHLVQVTPITGDSPAKGGEKK